MEVEKGLFVKDSRLPRDHVHPFSTVMCSSKCIHILTPNSSPLHTETPSNSLTFPRAFLANKEFDPKKGIASFASERLEPDSEKIGRNLKLGF